MSDDNSELLETFSASVGKGIKLKASIKPEKAENIRQTAQRLIEEDLVVEFIEQYPQDAAALFLGLSEKHDDRPLLVNLLSTQFVVEGFCAQSSSNLNMVTAFTQAMTLEQRTKVLQASSAIYLYSEAEELDMVTTWIQALNQEQQAEVLGADGVAYSYRNAGALEAFFSLIEAMPENLRDQVIESIKSQNVYFDHAEDLDPQFKLWQGKDDLAPALE